MFGARSNSQAKAVCIWVVPSCVATSERVDDWTREAAEWEEGHVGDATTRQFVDQRVVVASIISSG
jgi:hypothetical protein